MRTIMLDGGKTFEVDFAYAPTFDGACHIRLSDNRRLPEIAADFDGVSRVHFEDTATGAMDFDGYTKLQLIHADVDAVTIKMVKEAATDAI